MSTSPGSTTASSTIASPPVIKRGGMHPIFGIFVGGSPLTPDYALSTPNDLAENSIYSQRNNTTILKLNGKIDGCKRKHRFSF